MNFWWITRILQFPSFKTYIWNFFKSFLTNDENSTIFQGNAHIRFSINPRSLLSSISTLYSQNGGKGTVKNALFPMEIVSQPLGQVSI